MGLFLLLLALVSCTGAAPPEPGVSTPVPGPTTEAAPTATLPIATATAVLTATATPPPLATATPVATAAATPAGLQMRPVTPPAAAGDLRYEIIGFSTNGHAIEAFQLGEGERELIFVGGIHGGYEWNTVLLAYQVVDYFAAYPEEIPDGVTLTVIPVANPDGVVAVTGRSGRFNPADVSGDTTIGRVNGNGVDLNRNWDCDWAPTSWWNGRTLSGGATPFSEVETRVLRDFIRERAPELVVFWHSAVPGVFYGVCDGQFPVQTATWGTAYGAAAGYPASDTFDAYAITGDASNYLVSVGIPSFAVELIDHENSDLDRNLAGMRAVFSFFR